MKNIIIPIDFSVESLNGLKMAILFSKRVKVNILLVNVLQETSETDNKIIESKKNDIEKSLHQIIDEYSSQLENNSQINYLIKKGRIYQEIINLVEDIPDSIITASTHGASGFQELFIGSNAFRIISGTTRPVITLRKNYCPASISKIVMPVDISVDSRQKVPFTTELAELFGAEIYVVGIQTSRSKRDMQIIRSYTSQVAGYIEGRVHCESNEVFGANVAELVLNYANTIKADLISITTEQSPGISLIIGNTAHQILNKAETPVLCLTPKSIRKSGSFVTTGG